MFPVSYFAGGFFPPGYFEKNGGGGAAPVHGHKGAAPAIHKLILLALAEREHRSLIDEKEAHASFAMVLKARMEEARRAFGREVERRRFHSIYSLLIAEL